MRKTIPYVFTAFFCFFMQKTNAAYSDGMNKRITDSLQILLSRTIEDSTRINALNELAQQFIDVTAYDIADSLLRQALRWAETSRYVKNKGDSYNKIGVIYLNKTKIKQARDYFNRALLYDRQAGNMNAICRRYRNISISYFMEYNFPLSIYYADLGLELSTKHRFYQEMAAFHNVYGFIYTQKNEHALAISSFSKALELNKNPVDELVSYTSYKGIADSYEIQGNYYQALVCNLNALKTAKILKNKVKIEYCLHCLGNVYFDLGNISKAMDYWFMALKLSEETNNKLEYANLLALIGKSYKNLDDYDHALDYILKSIHISRELQLKSILVTDFVNIIDVYLGKGDTTTAIQYCFKSIELSNEMQTINFLNIPYNSLGKIYEVRSNQKNKDSADFYRRKAFNYYMESLKNAEKMGQKDNLIASYTFMGSFYLNENKNKQSENYLNNALKLSIESGEISFRKDIYELLSTLYGRKQDCEKERDYYKKFIALRDSLYNMNNAKKMIRSEINFEFERKHEKEQLEQERKNIIIEEERKRQRTIFWAVTIVAIIVSIACLYILKGYHQKKKLNKELQLRNQRIVVAHTIIEEKNREITDSINYALHIQQATLPDKSQIYRVLPQSFILFKPKDIVSGDFYFFSIAYDKIYLAAADCTGHGVPGGFMSMIGSEKLNRAIKESSETGSILSILNKSLKETLRQSEETRKLHDGMDISLCSIDLKTNIVEFSGANRPLWVIRKNATVLEEIRGTIASIGGYTENSTRFETHQVQLQRGDTIYLCSDGYADQFGNTGKKLTTRKFKNELLCIQEQSLPEQDKHLENFHNQWKGSEPQTDDILVIGFRL